MFSKQQKKGYILSCLYLIVIWCFFLSQSRFPSLWVRSITWINTPIVDTIAFNLLINHTTGEPKYIEILISFINWWYSNWKGMTFGILFAVGIMTLLRYVDTLKIPKNRAFLSIFWVLQWSAFWLCANCATPIGKSFLKSGISPIVSVNTIIASPSFNLVGIWLMFDIFPKNIVLVKLWFYILVLCIFVPLIFWKEVKKQSVACYTPPSEELFYKEFLRSFLFIVKKTLPWMFVAGILWVAIVAFIPSSILESLEVNILNILLVSLISFLLPVPMFFDLVFSGMIYNTRTPEIYSIILFCNLGVFSIYPLLVLRQDISIRKLLYLSSIFVLWTPCLAYILTL